MMTDNSRGDKIDCFVFRLRRIPAVVKNMDLLGEAQFPVRAVALSVSCTAQDQDLKQAAPKGSAFGEFLNAAHHITTN